LKHPPKRSTRYSSTTRACASTTSSASRSKTWSTSIAQQRCSPRAQQKAKYRQHRGRFTTLSCMTFLSPLDSLPWVRAPSSSGNEGLYVYVCKKYQRGRNARTLFLKIEPPPSKIDSHNLYIVGDLECVGANRAIQGEGLCDEGALPHTAGRHFVSGKPG